MVAVAQYEGRRCMALVPSVGLLLHSSIAVDECFQVMRLVPVSMLAVVQGYGSRCWL